MTTMVPFPDLNLMPESQPHTTAGITAGSSLSQKLKTTAEPVDETQKQSESISIHGDLPGSDHTPPPPSSSPDIDAEYNSLFGRVSSALAEGDGELSRAGSNSLAIVAVPDEQTGQPLVVQTSPEDNRVSTYVETLHPPPTFNTPQPLARITMQRDHEHDRYVFKRTRMIYDSLRLYLATEGRRRPRFGPRRKPSSEIKASSLMRERGLWLNQETHYIGSVPGVEVGDMFFYRLELCMVGLHSQLQAGIDYLTAQRSPSGEPIATSIIVSGGYEDDEDTGDVLIYTGHGGQDRSHRQCRHQKLEGGNLAMERSLRYGVEVRVIRGFKYDNNVSSKVYVYDGLYRIVDYILDIGLSGFGVFKFKLVRIQGQAEMGSARMKHARILKNTPLKDMPKGYISFDLSEGKESVPVYLYNDIDSDRSPLNYDYIAKSAINNVLSAQGETNFGCDCRYSCSDDCFCVRKNGGELPYDVNAILVRGKPVIFECGVLCSCGSGCRNRVSQRGMRNRMEVFRSKETGWGLRSLDVIQAGAFICEYAGVVFTKNQADIASMNGDVLVYPGRFTENWKIWGDLSRVYSDYVHPSYPTLPPVDFAMEVSEMRNVASYISHSRDPNVMVQFVLHDHHNLMFPRVMLFALENISPLTELSLDYVLADEVGEQLAICV